MVGVRGVQKDDASEYERPVVAELCRMTWLAFGPAGLIFSAAAVSKDPPGRYSVTDVLFWGITVLVVLTRFLDIRFFRGRTTDDKPASLSDWWQYSIKVGLFAVALWFIAHWAKG